MALYLVQHGKSLPKDIDPDQGLSDEGLTQTERIAKVARDYGVKVSAIQHSSKTRARRTAAILAAALQPEGGTEAIDGIMPLDDVTALAGELDPQQNLMLVGHLPFMERLVSFLITGSVEKPVFKFQNSGIVCLDRDPDSQAWMIVWTLMPKIG
ncbi:MAG: phosphohistidine phosphatase SixA [Desulfobacterales bacterium]|nr:MAG: phosphohistidine phosphatase SixA [Desulfobacterales bacterium]